MAFHQTVQKILLAGVRLPSPTGAAPVPPPAELQPLIAAVGASHQAFNARAVKYGHRYRSAFWMIYLLSALAVLCAVLPLALGWDGEGSSMAHYAVIWVVAELVVIGAVGAIYWLGHRKDWQGQWLAARTRAELAWYLPLIAPLVDFRSAGATANWYGQLFAPGLEVQGGADIQALCLSHAPLAQDPLAAAWSDPQFVGAYARWAAAQLEEQVAYHRLVAARQHALQHRVHTINAWLFGLTALGALAHLLVHSRALTLVTTFFPALGASLHGALAQSEAYRLEATSRRMADELARIVVRIRAAAAAGPEAAAALREAVLSALSLILDEHQDWHMLVQPHHLPLG